MKILIAVAVITVLALLAGAGYVYSGAFEVGADVPHSAPVFQLIEYARDRGVEVRAKDINVPKLDDPRMIAEGAEHYGAMCDGCHLAPGKETNEFRQGLYPQSPDLSRQSELDPAQAFWIIKHGLKMTAMPAWGLTHDDATIWKIAAFLKKMPGLTPEQYKQMTSSALHEHKEQAHDDAPALNHEHDEDAEKSIHHH